MAPQSHRCNRHGAPNGAFLDNLRFQPRHREEGQHREVSLVVIGLESRYVIALAVEISTELGNEEEGCTECEFGYAAFFFASNSSTLHS